MSFEKIKHGRGGGGSNAVEGVRIGVMKSPGSNRLRISLGRDICLAAGIEPESTHQFFWGCGGNEGQVKMLPDANGIRVFLTTPAAHAVTILTSRVPTWVDMTPATPQQADYTINDGEITINIPESMILKETP